MNNIRVIKVVRDTPSRSIGVPVMTNGVFRPACVQLVKPTDEEVRALGSGHTAKEIDGSKKMHDQ